MKPAKVTAPGSADTVAKPHPCYELYVAKWQRARDVMDGEDAVKAGAWKYLPKLDGQDDDDYDGYNKRASFFNASSRTSDGLVGMIFRSNPAVVLPKAGAVKLAMDTIMLDANMAGVPFHSYCKEICDEVMQVGRAGSLIDWEATENRAYVEQYKTESIINWRTERINGRMMLTLVVLKEDALQDDAASATMDGEYTFAQDTVEQYRVLRLVESGVVAGSKAKAYEYRVEIWQATDADKTKWEIKTKTTPLRRGKSLDAIPFVFHGPKNAASDIDKLPLDDVIQVNLLHFRLTADYNHGLHFTALPTAWVAGFDKEATLKIGSATAWVSDNPTAKCGYLEFTGQGLSSFEKALDRAENLMAVLGARLLEKKTRAAETAQALEIRASGEGSVLMNIAFAGSFSLTTVLRWLFWWNSTEDGVEKIGDDQCLVTLNTDFVSSRLTSDEIVAIVKAWQAQAITTETMLHQMKQGEILPPGVDIADEMARLETQKPPPAGPPIGGAGLPKPQGGGGGGGSGEGTGGN